MDGHEPPSNRPSRPSNDSTRLLDESFAMSFPSPADTLVDPRLSPPPQPRLRPGYSRIASTSPEDDAAGDLGAGEEAQASGAAAQSPQGLGIKSTGVSFRSQPHRRETSESFHPEMDSFETVWDEGASGGRHSPASYSSRAPLNQSTSPGHKAKRSGAYSIAAPSVRTTKSYQGKAILPTVRIFERD